MVELGMAMWRRAMMGVAGALLWSAAAVSADAGFARPLDGQPIELDGKWRVLDIDGRHTTSRCIGSRKTPQCAIETAMACFLRTDFELCKASYVPYYPTIFLEPRIDETDHRITYRFLRREPMTDEELAFFTKYPKEAERPIQPNDEVVIDAARLCKTVNGRRECSRTGKSATYVRLTEDGWRIVMTRSIRD
jgi:hypothetical protein